jgi:hypothetical protein
MRIAVIFNKFDGHGEDRLEAIAADLIRAFQGNTLYCHAAFGAEYLGSTSHVIGLPSIRVGSTLDYVGVLHDVVRQLLEINPDRLITVGGDGLAAYVADALISICGEAGFPVPPILGIAAGTANVGPIVSIPQETVGSLQHARGYMVRTGGIQVLDGGEHVAYGFNDVVIGDTLLATRLGSVVNISAVDLAMNGRKVEKLPGQRITSQVFSLSLNGKNLELGSADPCRIKQIIVSSLQFDDFYGRAITGALCRGAFEKDTAALALLDQVAVQVRNDSDSAPVLSGAWHLVFRAGDVIQMEGLGEDAHLIIDGNPFVRKCESVSFIYRSGLIPVWRLDGVKLREANFKEALP